MALSASVQQQLTDPITKHMHTDLARLSESMTIGEALESVRENPPAGRIIYFYVVDQDGKLRGVVPTRRLLLNSLSTRVADIMVKNVHSIPHHATLLDACEFFTLHRLLAFPIVDEDGRLMGLVDVGLYADELDDLEEVQRREDVFQLIGVHLAAEEQAAPWKAFRGRFPWLISNIAGGILAAFISGAFEGELQQMVSLALFIPVVLALAESVSIQSVSLALQALHGNRPTFRSILRRLRPELMTGLLLGGVCGGIIAVVAVIWQHDWKLAVALICGIGGGVTCAALIGTAIPNILRMLKKEPQVASGPIALATTDMITLSIYLVVARMLLA